MAPEGPMVVAAIALPFVIAALIPLGYRIAGDTVGYVGAATAAVSFGLVLSQSGTSGTVSYRWIPSLDVAVRLRVDGLAVLFALLASGIGVLIFAYATRYMRGKTGLARFYAALLAFMGSILGVAFAADLVLLFVFWELTSVCSFVLIGYQTTDEQSRYSARMAMIVTVGGGLCLLAGIAFLGLAMESMELASESASIGRFDLAAMLAQPEAVQEALREAGVFGICLVLFTIAAAAKSAQVPLYFWLPDAMVAPTPVSAFLHSATMVKVGVYALARLRPIFTSAEWMALLASLGLVTMAVGALLAVLASDIKELLAYSTASHLGLMVAALGFESHYGAEAGVFHLLSHALFKAALFLVAGIVAHEAGTRRLDELGGLRRELPATAAIAAVATASMAGVPPLSGFYSKEIFFEAAWEAAAEIGGLAWLFPAVAVGASVFTVVYSLQFWWLFAGDRPLELEPVHRPPALLAAPPAILVGLVALTSVRPGLAIDFVLQDAAGAASTEPVDVHAPLPTKLSPPVVMSALALALGIAGFLVGDRVDASLGWLNTRLMPVHPTRLYDDALAAIDRASDAIGRIVHDGVLRTDVTWVLLAACGLFMLGVTRAAIELQPLAVIGPSAALVVVLAVAVFAATAVATTDTHVTGVLTLGILGFMIAIFYILSSGPDLALTQLVVETLLLIVFLLVIEELPAFYGDISTDTAIRDGAVSVAVGVTAFLAVLLAVPTERSLPETAEFYVDEAVPQGGGTNVVNVILTDFRAFDTLGESVVILTAAVSVFVLMTMRNRGETQ